ncbi:hypothetical protein BD414DRAFT_486756 [Trametes punicea]|nr:hypothetical protein BD414DRAFT_486756 [Trametes punicea]
MLFGAFFTTVSTMLGWTVRSRTHDIHRSSVQAGISGPMSGRHCPVAYANVKPAQWFHCEMVLQSHRMQPACDCHGDPSNLVLALRVQAILFLVLVCSPQSTYSSS